MARLRSVRSVLREWLSVRCHPPLFHHAARPSWHASQNCVDRCCVQKGENQNKTNSNSTGDLFKCTVQLFTSKIVYLHQ